MGGYGPAPSDGPKLGRYRSPLDDGAVDVPPGLYQAPTLPKYRDRDVRTRHWWDTWKASPQSATFTGTDWQRLLMLAPLVDEYYRLMDNPAARGAVNNAMKILTEIRQSESLLGATHLDRLRGRIKIDREPTASADDDDAIPEADNVISMYRNQLGA